MCLSCSPLWGSRCWWAVQPRERCFYSWYSCLEILSLQWPPQPRGSAHGHTSGDWGKRENQCTEPDKNTLSTTDMRGTEHQHGQSSKKNKVRKKCCDWRCYHSCSIFALARTRWKSSVYCIFVLSLPFFFKFITTSNQTKANKNPSNLFVESFCNLSFRQVRDFCGFQFTELEPQISN